MTLTVDMMQRCFPARYKARLDEEAVDRINAALTDESTREIMRENILGFASVMKSPNYSIEEYVNAVKYISYTMMGDKNVQAWAKVFPDRYQRLLERGVPSKDINAHVRHYNKTKLVNEVREQSLIPSYILNADKFQEAINVAASIMNDEDVSAKVRVEAANSLMNHLKRPETQKIEMDIGIKESSMLQELKDVTRGLASKQRELIEQGGYSPKEIAETQILTVDAEYTEVVEDGGA